MNNHAINYVEHSKREKQEEVFKLCLFILLLCHMKFSLLRWGSGEHEDGYILDRKGYCFILVSRKTLRENSEKTHLYNVCMFFVEAPSSNKKVSAPTLRQSKYIQFYKDS
jgi:hypothetical protein